MHPWAVRGGASKSIDASAGSSHGGGARAPIIYKSYHDVINNGRLRSIRSLRFGNLPPSKATEAVDFQ